MRATEIERAFEMARSGAYAALAEIVKALKAEGYDARQLDPLVAFDLREELRMIIDPQRKRRTQKTSRVVNRRRVSKNPF